MDSAPMSPGPPNVPWPHAPPHRLSEAGTYFGTAGTYRRLHHFRSAARLEVFQRGVLTQAARHGWALEAWAVFSNHYHLVAHSPVEAGSAESLGRMLGELHEKLAKWVNRLDRVPARKVWHNFRETRLTYPKSFLARVKYVHHNPVHHGLVPVASQYPWCSAAWFEQTATPAQVKVLESFPIGRVKVYDDYEVAPEW